MLLPPLGNAEPHDYLLPVISPGELVTIARLVRTLRGWLPIFYSLERPVELRGLTDSWDLASAMLIARGYEGEGAVFVTGLNDDGICEIPAAG